jgi:hypothetical protein
MPEGITRTLTHAELVDLLRFVSELGKPGPLAVRTPATVQRWKVLRNVSKSLADSIPSPQTLRDAVLGTTADAWEVTYAKVNGMLPLAELHLPGQPKVLYLQAEVQVSKAGVVEIQIEGPGIATFWIDDVPHDKLGKTTVTLAPGRHRITIRVVVGDGPTPTLRVEVRKAAESKAVFELVQMD